MGKERRMDGGLVRKGFTGRPQTDGPRLTVERRALVEVAPSGADDKPGRFPANKRCGIKA